MRRDRLGLVILAVFTLAVAGIARDGKRDEKKDLLDHFLRADVPQRLDLLPRLTETFREEELPPEARYLIALRLLRPHLTWQAPNLIAPDGDRLSKVVREAQHLGGEDRWRWGEAVGAEAWMFADVPPDVRAAATAALVAWKHDLKDDLPKPPGPGDFVWHLKDPRHPDVEKAVALLSGLHEGDLGRQAHRWVDAVRRNNTVLTLDVTGSYGAGKTAPVVLDVRNAARVSCKLYRVRKPEDLLWVTERIGKDFLFCDHGLQYGKPVDKERVKAWEKLRETSEVFDKSSKSGPPPDALSKDPVWESAPAVADLKVAKAGWRDRRDWYDEERNYRGGDGDYFRDSCDRYRQRLGKEYRPEVGHWSSWQCDRVVEVPGKAVAEAGAYVLVVEAHGQTAYAPLIVEPLSLTLRRCRDGVFVAVADTEGKQPVAGATVHGREMLGTAETDAEGVAFAKLYAGGDRAVLVHKDGRFAVGGFGRVFEGIYVSPLDRQDRLRRDLKAGEGKAADAKHRQAQLYADRHVVAAYTDRPTYRPDQEVQFKVIVRRLAPDNPDKKDRPRAFRADEFEYASRLEVPPKDTEVPFEVLDPNRRAVATGRLTLNDFGTAAGTAKLSAEAAVGTYTLRLRLSDVWRVVPEFCAVEFYRLPSFKLDVKGVPEKVRKAETLRVELSGEYYFGKLLAGARVEVRLTREGDMRRLSDAEAVLDADGKAVVKLEPGKALAPGRYVVRCELSDESGRSVRRVLPYTVEAPERPQTGLGALPRFVPQDRPLEFPTTADSVVAEQVWSNGGDDHGSKRFRFLPRDGKATLEFSSPGWYTLTAGKEQTEVFVYGGSDHPSRTLSKRQDRLLRKSDEKAEDDSDEFFLTQMRGWVDLTNDQTDRYADSPFDHRGSHLLALFDRQEAKVGESLRVLVYVPAKRARLLFTVEGYTVFDYVTATTAGTRGSYHVVELPIKRRHLPHFYLRGRILEAEGVAPEEQEKVKEQAEKLAEDRDKGTDPRWCRIDVTDPKALPHGETLRVELKTDRAEYKPGESVDVSVKVTDRAGKPAAAEVSLAAVDASVYAFGEDRLSSLAAVLDDPHPAQRFHVKAWRSSIGRRWAHLAALADNRDRVVEHLEKAMQQASKEGKSAEGKDGLRGFPPDLPSVLGEMPVSSVPLARLRSDFRETAAWLPQLRTGADGEVRTSFKLPDSTTRYRLSAVALTKGTDLGTGRAELRATMPLSVQLILPRFAVERDRVWAVAVVHNNGLVDRTCVGTWTVENASMVAARADMLVGWKVEGHTLSVPMVVPAGKSARIELFVRFDKLGSAKVQFRCGDEAGGDAEERTLPVQTLGRQRAVSDDGSFTGSTKVRLPAGFAARDVRVVLSRDDVARALDGVAGLVEYPHGCVEQTMSRFLPAVLVREAARRGPVALPPDVEEKLPLVLKEGLTRLYKFQHKDGGWGWWENDKTDPRMTAYVVYGLARCAGAGVAVDKDVLARGSAWLKLALRDGALTGPLAARAWLALAHAGHADPAALRPFAEKLTADGVSSESRCLAALACRLTGLTDVAGKLWTAARDWRPDSAEETALLLKAQLTFAEPLAAAHRTAARLTKMRTGLGWDSTQSTAAALDALSLLVPLLPADVPPKAVRVTIGWRPALNLSRPDDLKAKVYRAHLAGERLPLQDPLEIEIVAEGGGPVYYTVEALGTQRLDKVEPIGDTIKVSRSFETLDGRPLPGKVTAGQTIAVRLRVDLERPQTYVLIEDRRPAGCEFADDRLHGKGAADLANVEFRDDRVCAFAPSLPAGRHEYVYYLRAETPGVSQVLPGCAYPMYEDRVRGETGAARLEIEPARR
jgi:uncharacterized protein YfaS (alpha-2-macroglobulin family)